MVLRAFKEIESNDFSTNKLQDSIREFASNLKKGVEILDGIVIEDIELVANTRKVINHGLGRKLIGWIVTRSNTKNRALRDHQDTNPNTDRTLILEPTLNMTISIWVF